MGVIIEMLGAPGAGKTSMVPALERSCRDAALEPHTPNSAARVLAARTVPGRIAVHVLPPRIQRGVLWGIFRLGGGYHTVRFAITNPRLTIRVVRSQWRRPAGSDARRRRVLYWYLRTMGTYGLAVAHLDDHEAIIFDEGFAHRAVQLFASVAERPTPDQIDSYVRLIPAPDLLVHVVARPQTCRARVESRGVWARLAHRSARELDSFIDNAHAATTAVRRAAADRGWPVLEIDNDEVRADPGGALPCGALGAVATRSTRSAAGA